jgi:hypothetical protein
MLLRAHEPSPSWLAKAYHRRTANANRAGGCPAARGPAKAAAMANIVVDEERAAANSRLTAIRLATLTLRWMENWRRNVEDYDSAMILLAVVAITASRLLRSELEPELRDMAVPFPEEALARCNISSIAAATGINRETTRRRVRSLIERGFLVRLRDGSIRFRPGYLQQPRTIDLVRRQLETFVRAADELSREGTLKPPPAAGK